MFAPCPKPAPRVRTPKPLKRGGRIKPRNEKRAAERYDRDFGAKSSWVRTLCCVVSGSEGSERNPIVVAHVKGRGAGGDSRKIVPLLASLHSELHTRGQETFAAAYRWVDLEEAADIIELRWRQFDQTL